MISVPEALQQRLRRFGQEHVLAFWDRLDDTQRRELLGQLANLDLEGLRQLYARKDQKTALLDPAKIQPIAPVDPGQANPQQKQLGEEAFRAGQVAMLVVAGGQGSRLGFEYPKGMCPIGPVTHKSLFQIHAEKVLALRRRYGAAVPFLIMTSPATHQETVDFFGQQQFFGLPADDVWFFTQGTMPALDLATGKLLLESPGQLFLSPNGHGGTLTALAESGLLARLRKRGFRTLFYFQVDNPLIQLGDLAFLGMHLAGRADVSSKVIPKEVPEEKLGLFVLIDGRLAIIEYSDIPKDLAAARDGQGRLRLWAGNPAIHLFAVDFLERVLCEGPGLPWHVAKKKVPCLDGQGRPLDPKVENALKFEMFIFDVLPLAERWTVAPTSRREEFEPVKNPTGPESPASVRAALINRAADWLEQAGVAVPRGADGQPAWPLEISPLFALDAEELAVKVDRKLRMEGPRNFGSD